MRRWLLWGVLAFVVLIGVAVAASYAVLRRSLPQVDGTVTVAGITAPIDIIRDADAIPHIFGATKADALFGLGYVHAQDRLWQMEFQRRIGHGRLSEIFGAATVSQDRFLRTVGYGRAARRAWAVIPGAAKQQIDAYLAGVNAFITAHRGSALPPEFGLLRFEPEPWTGPDVIVWVKMMAWDLSANYSFELLRHDLVRAVGAERMAQLMPPYARDGLSILTGPAGGAGGAGGEKHSTVASAFPIQPIPPIPPIPPVPASLFDSLTLSLSKGESSVRDLLLGGARAEGLGSNNWVVDGTLTASGKPLLANDPHLGTRLPSTWYLAHLSAGEFDVVGATLPGTPAVALGRNRFIAWGATNVAADVEDLYRERVDDAAKTAEFRGLREPLSIIRETIQVKGATEPIQLDVRLTRHGPLISDAVNANTAALQNGPRREPLDPLALRWTALDDDDSTIVAFLELNEARTWDQFTAALRKFVVPSQNFVYADVDGHIGYYAPGRIPVRAAGDGSLPAEGWTGDAEWTGWIPFEALPHLYDPPSHVIVTANHRPAPASYPYVLGLEWPEPYRAQRIIDMLAAPAKDSRAKQGFTPDDFARMQADTLSLHAKALLPLMLQHARPDTDAGRGAVEMLRKWDANASGNSAAAAIFEAWFHQLAPNIVADDVSPAVIAAYQSRYTFITRFVVTTLAGETAAWCDDVKSDRKETCADAVTAALNQALITLTVQLGNDMSVWRWDAVHPAVFPHQGLDAVPSFRGFLSRSVPNGGDWSTVNVGPVAAETPFEQRSVAGYRQVIDLSPANNSRFLNDVGQSGHPMSKHYDDFLADWQAVRHRPMRMDRAQIEKGAIGHLRLVPASGGEK